jgi:NAD(P)-dependent dehydrogenase (short-subunit alcohol dehydrogenase family)
LSVDDQPSTINHQPSFIIHHSSFIIHHSSFCSSNSMKLTDKRVLITGGTKGIGAAIAIDLARQGCDVAINGRHDDAEAADVKRQILAAGRKCVLVLADVASPEETTRVVHEAANALDGIDILVHSAGGPSWNNIDQCEPAQWAATMDIHVNSTYFLCRAALPLMRPNRDGAIILISSVAGIRGVPNAISYATAKGAVLQFTRCLARDVADDNIRVNCVAPGIIRTRFHESMTPEAKAHNLANRIPLHREGTAEDVAQAVRMLITNEFITGETIVIDGGTSMQIGR